MPEIVSQTLVGGKVVDRLLYVDPATKKHCRGIDDIPFYQRQQRFVLKECGTIDPEDIHEYIHHGGYAAAQEGVPEDDAGADRARKSRSRACAAAAAAVSRPAANGRRRATQKSAKKYVICNADEGDPGAFMNRSVMEGNPHSVLEGLMIAARAIGADETLDLRAHGISAGGGAHAPGGGGRRRSWASWATTSSAPARR